MTDAWDPGLMAIADFLDVIADGVIRIAAVSAPDAGRAQKALEAVRHARRDELAATASEATTAAVAGTPDPARIRAEAAALLEVILGLQRQYGRMSKVPVEDVAFAWAVIRQTANLAGATPPGYSEVVVGATGEPVAGISPEGEWRIFPERRG